MEILNELKKTYQAAADKTTEVAGNLTENAKLRYQIGTLNTRIKDVFRKIGALVYDAYQNGAEHTEQVEQLCADVSQLQQARDAYQEQLLALQKSKKCPVCRSVTEQENAFCPKCGAAFPQAGAEAKKAEAAAEPDEFAADTAPTDPQ